jgi:hypothetical protein
MLFQLHRLKSIKFQENHVNEKWKYYERNQLWHSVRYNNSIC